MFRTKCAVCFLLKKKPSPNVSRERFPKTAKCQNRPTAGRHLRISPQSIGQGCHAPFKNVCVADVSFPRPSSAIITCNNNISRNARGNCLQAEQMWWQRDRHPSFSEPTPHQMFQKDSFTIENINKMIAYIPSETFPDEACQPPPIHRRFTLLLIMHDDT